LVYCKPLNSRDFFKRVAGMSRGGLPWGSAWEARVVVAVARQAAAARLARATASARRRAGSGPGGWWGGSIGGLRAGKISGFDADRSYVWPTKGEPNHDNG